MKYITILFACIFFNSSCQGESDPIEETPDKSLISITYNQSKEIFSNPERGFMHTWTVFSEGNALKETTLTYLKQENVSIILRLYYLEKFKETELSDTQLNLIKTDFERLRNSGIKCVLRFAYTDSMDEPDAPLSIVEKHLDQLKPIFTENADVIAFVQAGFIGAWGEWHASSNGLTSLANKKAVLNKLLEVFPKEVKIQLRTPKAKQEIFDYTTAMGPDTGYGESNKARVGFHNDCFMASATDYGTYENPTEEKQFISQEAFFVPTGGETCPPTDVPLASCNTAETEMTLLKWTYLNLDYYGPVLQEWRNGNCFEDFERKLGYRLSLKLANLKPEASVNGNYNLSTTINNLGFAPVYNSKNSYLVFRSTSNGEVFKKKLGFDVRKVVPKASYELNESINLSGIPAGKYELLLKIEDSSSKLIDRPEYCIRLANTDVWEATTGLNKLSHNITIK